MVGFTVKYHKKKQNGKRNRRRKQKRDGNRGTVVDSESEEADSEDETTKAARLPRAVGRRIALGVQGSLLILSGREEVQMIPKLNFTRTCQLEGMHCPNWLIHLGGGGIKARPYSFGDGHRAVEKQ